MVADDTEHFPVVMYELSVGYFAMKIISKGFRQGKVHWSIGIGNRQFFQAVAHTANNQQPVRYFNLSGFLNFFDRGETKVAININFFGI